MTKEPNSQKKLGRKIGITHLFAAAGYSISGLKRLSQETAFRHELIGLIAILILIWWLGGSVLDLCLALALFLLLIAVEALNTAIEVLVDHLSPQWSLFAKEAKDLGSLAVMCLLGTYGLFVSSLFYRYW